MRMDRKGMIGFPMRLAVTFLILSVSVPSMLYLADGFEDDSDVSAVTHEADRISDVLSKTYYTGTGSRNTVDIHVDGGCSIVIGGSGSDAYSMTVMKGDAEKDKLYMQRPAVRIIGDALEVSGDRTLMCESVEDDGHYGVKVTVID